MTNLSQIVRRLREERTRIQDQLGRLDAAIEALQKVVGGAQEGKEPRQKRRLSLAARSRIAAAQRARWAKVRQQEKTVAKQKTARAA